MELDIENPSQILRSEDFAFPEVEMTTYKDEPGTWMTVSRRVLHPSAATSFETRYFEIAPGGYTSFEKHRHEHIVVGLRGIGKVRLGDEWSELAPGDTVRVSSMTPHQFRNDSAAPFGILCIVDRDRDRPIILGSSEPDRASD